MNGPCFVCHISENTIYTVPFFDFFSKSLSKYLSKFTRPCRAHFFFCSGREVGMYGIVFQRPGFSVWNFNNFHNFFISLLKITEYHKDTSSFAGFLSQEWRETKRRTFSTIKFIDKAYE